MLEWFRMTADALKDCNKKYLAQMAKEQGISGWHAMRKDQLIRALSVTRSSSSRLKQTARSAKSTRPSRPKPLRPKKQSTDSHEGVVPRTAPGRCFPPPRLRVPCLTRSIMVSERPDHRADPRFVLAACILGTEPDDPGAGPRRPSVKNGIAARPILRLMDVSSEDTTSATERQVRDIPIHGGVNNWYIDVLEPPRSYRIDIGYLSRRGKFYVLARSNVVTTPKAGVTDTLEENWSNVQKQFERDLRIHSTASGRHMTIRRVDLRDLFEERLRRPMTSAVPPETSATAALPSLGREFHFQIDAELIVYGTTEPNARVTLQGEPVTLRSDGTFTVRFSLPDSRQIIPAVAASADGSRSGRSCWPWSETPKNSSR